MYLHLQLVNNRISLTGLIVGAIIRYAGSTNQVTHIDARPDPDAKYNLSVPPDIVRFHFPDKIQISTGGKRKQTFYNSQIFL